MIKHIASLFQESWGDEVLRKEHTGFRFFHQKDGLLHRRDDYFWLLDSVSRQTIDQCGG